MNKKLFVVGAFALTALLVGCGNDATLKNGEEVVAELDGKTITVKDLYAEIKKLSVDDYLELYHFILKDVSGYRDTFYTSAISYGVKV